MKEFLIQFVVISVLIRMANFFVLNENLDISQRIDLESYWPMRLILPQFVRCEVSIVYTNPMSFSLLSPHQRKAAEVDLDISEMELMLASSGTFISLSLSQKEEKENKFDRFKDVHRYSPLCGVALFMVENEKKLEKKELENLFMRYTPLYGPILRKDEDYFIFVVLGEEQAERILLSKEFGAKIKYKMALIPTANEFHVKTVDMYKNQGDSVIRRISKEDENPGSNFNILFADNSNNFYGKTFKMSVPKVDFRFEIVWNKTLQKYVPRRGYYKSWLEFAMMKYNFTYNLFPGSFGGSTGKRLKNGTWKGAVADILEGTADWAFVIGHIFSRHKFVEWSGPVSYEQMVFLNHRPRTFISPKAIFWPFTILVWALFLATLFLVPLVFKGFSLISGYNWRYFTMLEHTVATVLEQDHKGPNVRLSEAVKILEVFMLLFGMIISVAYRGKLTSLMAFPVSSWIPTTFSELSSSNFRVGLNVVGKGGAAYSIFTSSQSPVYKKLFERMELYPNGDECLLKATQIDLCCIMWEGAADYISARNLSDRFGNIPLVSSVESTSFIADGLVWEKRAVFRKYLDRSIWSAIEVGLIPRWFQMDLNFVKNERWNGKSNMNEKHKLHVEDKGPKKLKISHFKGIFLILVSGIGVSMIIFLYEKSVEGFSQFYVKRIIQHSRK